MNEQRTYSHDRPADAGEEGEMNDDAKTILLITGGLIAFVVFIFLLPVMDYAWTHWNCYWETHCPKVAP